MNRIHTLPLLLLLLLLTLAGATTALPAAADEARRSVGVSGEAERRVAPDMAILRMAVVNDGEAVAPARREADATIARARALLTARGIASVDVDSSGLEVMPRYRWNEATREQERVGYRVTRRLEIRLLDLTLLGDLLIELSEAGINDMQSPDLGLVDPEATYREVLAEAVANARGRAAVVAETLGASLGDAIAIDTQRARPPQPLRREAMMMAADAGAPAPGDSYQSGDLTFRVDLTARFELR